MINYPNGLKKKSNTKITKEKRTIKNAANRGMSFENDINVSNEYYKNKGLILIYKRPTPINIVKVDYSIKGGRIKDAYFEKQSTTDYNGVYKGHYIDFEAKTTKSKSSFPLSNIYKHQIDHLKNVIKNKGVAFFLIRFESYNKVFLVDADWIIAFLDKKERKSIPYEMILKEGIEVKPGFNPRLNYLDAIITKYFK
jgi:recombination protein U